MEHDELAQYLDSLKREDCYRVDETLKESLHERTQRVYFVGENGSESGPFIRKFIQQESGLGSAYQRVFEAQHSGCRFKYIPDILECYARDGQLVVVMEYVHGETLQEVVYQNDPSLELAQDVFPHICDAVSELHNEFDPPIIHRDLKPSNIVLTGQGLALIDFGISREYREQADCDTAHFGTREFAPPEQFGFGQTGVYSDVYSLGMVLYYCLTEQIPGPQTRKSAFADSRIPESVRKVIEHACALDPAMRFASAAELKDAFLEAVSPVSSDVSLLAAKEQKASKKNSSSKWIILGAVAAACVIAIGIAALLLLPAVGSKSSDSKSVQIQGTQSSSAKVSDAWVSSSASDRSSNDAVSTEVLDSSIKYYVPDPTAAPPQQWDATKSSALFTESVAGVQIEIPEYFNLNTQEFTDDLHFKLPDKDSFSAEIILLEMPLKDDLDTDKRAIQRMEDEFVTSIMQSNDSLLNEVAISIDNVYADRPSRTISFKGSVDGVTVYTDMYLFLNPENKCVGAVICPRTLSKGTSYSADLSNVLVSAM